MARPALFEATFYGRLRREIELRPASRIDCIKNGLRGKADKFGMVDRGGKRDAVIDLGRTDRERVDEVQRYLHLIADLQAEGPNPRTSE